LTARAAALLALSLACGASDGDGGTEQTAAPILSEPPQVLLGTGEASFEPIDGEPHLGLVAGVQGGFHVWASLLAYGFADSRLDMVLETSLDDDPASSMVMRARLSLRDAVDANGEPVQSFAGFPAQVQDARCANGKRIQVTVTLSDTTGASAQDTRYCIADVDERQRREDCAE